MLTKETHFSEKNESCLQVIICEMLFLFLMQFIKLNPTMIRYEKDHLPILQLILYERFQKKNLVEYSGPILNVLNMER